MYETLGIRRYRETEVASVGPEKLIVQLYEALLRQLRQTKKLTLARDPVTANHHLDSAQAIVSELRGALDHRIGGEIADNLAAVYDYVFRENLSFLLDRDVIHMDRCIQVLSPLLDAWRQIPPGTAAQYIRETAAHPDNVKPPTGLEATDPAAVAGRESLSSTETQPRPGSGPDSLPDLSSSSEPSVHSICVSA